MQIALPGYMLAMKLYASRDETDLKDAATLFTVLGCTTSEQAIELLTRLSPGTLVPPNPVVVRTQRMGDGQPNDRVHDEQAQDEAEDGRGDDDNLRGNELIHTLTLSVATPAPSRTEK